MNFDAVLESSPHLSATMDSSFRPPNTFSNVDDNVQEALEKERGRADGIVVLVQRPCVADLPLDIELDGEWSDSSSEIDTPPSNHYPHLPSTELDNHVSDVSGDGSHQLQTPIPTATGPNQNTLDDVEDASSESSYQSVRSDTPTNSVKVYELTEQGSGGLGIYGSKEEIVRFLLKLRVADDTMATHLLSEPRATEAHLTLRSGLYILRTTTDEPKGSEKIYVIHWPEQNTWDDSAPSQVRRNRTMLEGWCGTRLMKVTRMKTDGIDEDDEGDRIIKCVVQRTTEQEESVQVREGFKVNIMLSA
ncbi:hypothetical protein EDC04DRAFT_2606993 [Pisolithus marmoratus]|nr:hypothetical protein EDC04DRAFT_2606993 [Pisolithus marmoratus]